MASSISIARKFIELANKEGRGLTPMQLLKLVYIAHGWMLGLYSRPLIDDPIEAWKYGPVIPKLYQAIRHFRDKPVTEITGAPVEELSDNEENIIQETYEKYGHFSAVKLSSITHLPDTPWKKTMDLGFNRISDDLIYDYYSELASSASSN
jgi:hypothetical protein